MPLLAYAFLLALPGAEGAPRIQHEPADCMVADSFPRLEARVEPDEDVKGVRLRFHREGDSRWYAVPMYRREGVWSGVLPKPNAGEKPVRYVIEVKDRKAGPSSSEEFVAAVASSAASCPGERVAGVAVSPPQVNVEVPEGTRSLPKGFATKNVAGSYPSGKPVKGRLRSVLIGSALVGGAATAVAAANPSAPSTQASVELIDLFPAPGSVVSVSRPALYITIRLNLPVSVDSGTVRVEFHEGPADASPSCIGLSAPFFGLDVFEPLIVVTRTLPLPTGACELPFTVSVARIRVVDASGVERYRTGQAPPDVSLNYRFVP